MKTLTIKIDTAKYATPTEEDIKKGKTFILQREEAARRLADTIDAILLDTAERIMRICYQYRVPAEQFSLDSDKKLFEKISSLMDAAEEQILYAIETASTSCTDDDRKKRLLALYLLSLGNGKRGYKETLTEYLRRFLYDIEALAASYKLSRMNITQALAKTHNALHYISSQPEVRKAYRAPTMRAIYIQTKGVHFDFETGRTAVGVSNSGATNVTTMARNTLTAAWMQYQAMMYEESGADGYVQLRGSNYPCAACDDETGFHEGLEKMFAEPYPHPNCRCFRVPVFRK